MEQSWETCKYGLHSGDKDDTLYECKHEKITEFYPRRRDKDGTLIALLYPIPDLEVKYRQSAIKILKILASDLNMKLQEPIEIDEKHFIQAVLTRCKHCKYYETLENGAQQ